MSEVQKPESFSFWGSKLCKPLFLLKIAKNPISKKLRTSVNSTQNLQYHHCDQNCPLHVIWFVKFSNTTREIWPLETLPLKIILNSSKVILTISKKYVCSLNAILFNFGRTKDKRVTKVLNKPHTYFKFLTFPYKPHTLPLSLRLSVSLILSGFHYRSFICTHLYCPEPVISLFENFSKIFCLIEPPILVCDFLTGQWLTRKRRLTTTAREILIKATCSCFIQPLKIKLFLFKQIRVQNPNWYHRSKFWLRG